MAYSTARPSSFILLLAALALWVVALPAQAGKKTWEARTTITVTTFEGDPVKGAHLLLEQQGGDLKLEGDTDKDGRLVVDLPEGALFAVTCTHEGKTYRFGDKEIPDVGGPLNFALNLKIKSSAVATSNAAVQVRSTEARTVVTVMNSLGQPEPDAVVRFVGVDTNQRFEGTTDSNGQWLLQMPRAKTFQIACDKYGVTFDLGPHEIPDVDSFILNLKLRLERSILLSGGATQAEKTVEASVTQVVVSVSVHDGHDNPESEAKITLTPKGGGEARTGITDSSGRFVLVLPAGETYALTVEKYGLVAEAGEHTIPDAESHEIVAEVNLAATYLETFRLENVYFDTAKATLRPESYAPLNELVEVLKKNPTMIIELAGHTDSRGDDLYNLNLSRSRANSVRDYVIAQGIPKERLAAKGYGEFEPVVANDTPENMQMNRRTEVRIIQR